MAGKLKQPPRVFKMGALLLTDLNPELDALKAVRLHAGAHPQLTAAKLSEPRLQGGKLIYTVLTQDPGDNG